VQILPEGAYYNDLTETVCFTPSESGDYTLSMSVIDDCEITSSDEIGCIRGPRKCSGGYDSSRQYVFLCDPAQICFPVSITDLDDDIADIEIIGPGTYNNGYLCFMATEAGQVPDNSPGDR